MGGDTDTNACIVGSIVEALYGMTDEQKELYKENLTSEFNKVKKRINHIYKISVNQ